MRLNTTILRLSSALALGLAGLSVSLASGARAPVVTIAAVPGEVETAVSVPSMPIPEELSGFADAPDGVDPFVTGPVSTAFRQRQQVLDCENAAWPNIPAVCFPD
jgi:hypothetical protein